MIELELPYSLDSVTAFARFGRQPWGALLDSATAGGGRFDLVVARPEAMLTARQGQIRLERRDGSVETHGGSPWDLLRRELGQHAQAPAAELPFTGGALGYVGYDLDREHTADASGMPALALGLYPGAIVVDHRLQRSRLVAQDHATGRDWMAAMQRELDAPAPSGEAFKLLAAPACQTTQDEYHLAFDRIAAYIRAGDCYQVNLALRYTAPCTGDPWPLYQVLRQRNPAPYSAWLNLPFGQVLSSSPEQFLELRSGQVRTRPIKGTRPRSADPVVDTARATELAASLKDRAENLMIVDLLRNDLGKACATGSVAVPELFRLETFASVHHLVSTVTGRLAPGKDAFDLLAAAFPGGSITGAPKHRAMQIIAELENQPRGVYCGAIGYLGADGDMDLNIAIRTLTVQDGEVSFWVGSGIVADSDPAAEYQECQDKAQALLAALGEFVGT